MTSHEGYDPKSFWDAKAQRAGKDFEAAVCFDDPTANTIIDRIQKRYLLFTNRLAMFLDPFIGSFLPGRLHTRDAMVLQKLSKTSSLKLFPPSSEN